MKILPWQVLEADRSLIINSLLKCYLRNVTGTTGGVILPNDTPDVKTLFIYENQRLTCALTVRSARLSYEQEADQEYLYKVDASGEQVTIFTLEAEKLVPMNVICLLSDRSRPKIWAAGTPLQIEIETQETAHQQAMRISNQALCSSAFLIEDPATRNLALLEAHALIPEHPLVTQHYTKTFEFHRYAAFELVTHGNLLIARGRKPIRSTFEERLIAFGVVTDSLQRPLEALMHEMETLTSQKLFHFNRIVLHQVTPPSRAPAECAAELSALVALHLFELRLLRVEKILLRTDDLLIEVKGILDGLPTTQTRRLTAHDQQTQVSPANETEAREILVMERGRTWAYRLPFLIDQCVRDLQLTPTPRPSSFTEMDLDHKQTVINPKTGAIDYNVGELIPVTRPAGSNEASVVIGLSEVDFGLGSPVKRLLIIGDLSHSSQGAIRGRECVRINAAIRYASRHRLAIDWYSASYGVQIHHERGVEGLDAAASTLREIVTHCHHRGLQINLIIDEANIGAQSYWDSMAAILYETSGITIMTPQGSMALTGPKALTCALLGTVNSEEINKYVEALYPQGLQSLSGYHQVHGPNGEAMLLAQDLRAATRLLLLHHYYSFLKPDERLVSRRQIAEQSYPVSADMELLHSTINKFLTGKKPDRQVVINALRDSPSPPALRFWSDAQGIKQQSLSRGDLPQTASTIVEEILLDGHPTLLIFTPTGPLTPTDSSTIARAIFKASGRMQVLLIGSLSGFNCDPLSMSNRQLQEGAWIGRAIVDHQGPILIVNLGIIVGGTFVVFNKQMMQDVRILAVQGARVQVIGGKSAAKVVFHSHIRKRADQDERLLTLRKPSTTTSSSDALQRAASRSIEDLENTFKSTRVQVIQEIENREAEVFDRFHNAQRALKVGSIDAIVPPEELRSAIISTFEQMRTAYLQRTPPASGTA